MKCSLLVSSRQNQDIPCCTIEAYKSEWLIASKSVAFLIGFIARFWADDAIGLARYKIEAALEGAGVSHSFELHIRCVLKEILQDFSMSMLDN